MRQGAQMGTGHRQKLGRRGLDRHALWLIASLVVVATLSVTSALTRSWLPARYAWLRLHGRVDARCSLQLAQAAAARLSDRIATSVRNRAGVRFIRESDGIRLYETARGPVWTSTRDADPVGSASTFHEAGSIRWSVIDALPFRPVRAGDIVLDAGAHIGESSFAALELGAARVVAIEPDPANLAALRRNLQRQIAEGRVVVIEKGVYDRVGRLTFVHRENSRDGWFVEGSNTGDSLAITTIDQIVADLALPRVDFIKMDIEGSEVPALRGARETLRRFVPRLAVGTYHKPEDLSSIEETVITVRPSYTVSPSMCLDKYADHDFRHLFPFILYFSADR